MLGAIFLNQTLDHILPKFSAILLEFDKWKLLSPTPLDVL